MTKELIEPFKTQLKAFSNHEDTWQEKAWSQFAIKELPHPSQDGFRNLRLRDLYSQTFLPSSKELPSKEEIEKEIASECKESFLVFVNGKYFPSLSSCPKELQAIPFNQAEKRFGSFLTQYMNRRMKEEENSFSLLNYACAEGVFIYLPLGIKLKNPLHILHWISSDHPTVISPRVLLFADKQSKIEVYFSQKHTGGMYWNNGVFDLLLEEEAKVTWNSIYNLSSSIWHFDAFRATLRGKSRFSSLAVTNGSHSFTQDYKIDLLGEEAEGDLSGLCALSAQRQAQMRVLMRHQEPFTRSHQKFKNLLGGVSKSYFEGKIFVTPKAQKTEAFQASHHLLLSETALASSCPMLEILADDVKASHGATVGQLNSEEIFYLKSRGLPDDEARLLLTQGFSREIIDRIPSSFFHQKALQCALQCLNP